MGHRRLSDRPAHQAMSAHRIGNMRLSPPTLFLFLISLILAILAMVTKLGYLPVPRYLPHQEYWLAITAYLILTVGVLFRGL
jgi:hypothetical protein